MNKIVSIVKNHIVASGPVSFKAVAAYVAEQSTVPVEDWQIAGILNGLLGAGIISLYDDGVSFTAA